MQRHDVLRHAILEDILHGRLGAGGLLPTEQALTETHRVSRVTVRRALDDLKRQGVVSATPGRGTAVATRRGGFAAPLDLIAVVAPVHNPFFAGLVHALDERAARRDALVLFKQDFRGQMLTDPSLYLRLLDRGVRHLVLWPHRIHVDLPLLDRVRSAGVNLVLFDQPLPTTAADVVALDAGQAMATLVAAVRERVSGGPIVMLGHDEGLPSEQARRAGFEAVAGKTDVFVPVPRLERDGAKAEAQRTLRSLMRRRQRPVGIVCSHGGLGVLAADTLEGPNRPVLGSIDATDAMRGRPILAIRQPIDAIAGEILQSLVEQSERAGRWRPRQRLLPGELVDMETQT